MIIIIIIIIFSRTPPPPFRERMVRPPITVAPVGGRAV